MRLLMGVVLILFVLVVMLSSAFPSLFSRLTHPCTPTPRPIVKSTIEFDQLWTICTGLNSNIRGMLIYDNKLIVGDGTRDALVAFDMASDEVQWQTPMLNYSELILDKIRQRLYTAAFDGKIYAIDANTGDVVWLNDDYQGKHDGYVPLLLADGQLIGRNVLTAPPRPINVDTGAFGETISVASTRVFPDGHAWIVQNSTLTAINALTGKIVWEATEANISDDRCLNDVQVNQTTVLAKICEQLVAYDFLTRTVRWTQDIPHMVGYAALTDDIVYTLIASQ